MWCSMTSSFINHNFNQGDRCIYCGQDMLEALDPKTMMPNECNIGPDGVSEIEREALIIMKVIKLCREL